MSELPQSSAQNLVRRLGVIGFFASAALGPLLYLIAEPVKTRASTPRPEWNFDAFRSGALAKSWEVHLEESSPVTVALRSWHNDHLHRLGGLSSKSAFMARSEWVFLGNPRDLKPADVEAHAEVRVQYLRVLKAECDRLGLALLCAVAPDKATVYPDYAFLDGLPRPVRSSLYGRILLEMAEAGIESVDLRTLFQDLRRANPEVLLYKPRDTHWDWAGARAAGARSVDRLTELAWDLGPRVDYLPQPIVEGAVVPDLLEVFGLLPDSGFVQGLGDRSSHVSIGRLGPGGRSLPLIAEPKGARLAVCGDSFGVALMNSIRGYSGRLVDVGGVEAGAGPHTGLLATLKRVRRGDLDLRVIVWVFVERSYTHKPWINLPDPTGG